MVFVRILLNSRNNHLERGLLPESQCGIRRHRGTTDMIFAARQLQEKCQEMRTHLYSAFVDLTKAFDTVVNTSPITTFGTFSFSLGIGLWRLSPWIFVVADIPCGILGADFLAAFDLLIDCGQSRLHNKTTNRTVRGFVGQMVDSNGIQPLLLKVAAIRDFPPPSSKRQLQQFLDMVNFYPCFLSRCVDTILPLTGLLSGPKGLFELFADTLAAFDKVKAALADATLLTHFSYDAPLPITVVASNVAVGAVLQQHLAVNRADRTAGQRRVGILCDEDVSGLQLQGLLLTTGNRTILCDDSATSHRPFVPPSLYCKIFSSLHNLSHPGSRTTDKLVSDRFVWPGMQKDLKAWTRACLGCQRHMVQRHNKTPISTLPTPDARFSHVHLDIVGLLPLSNGWSHRLTCVDRFTWLPEDIPPPDVTAPTVVKAFLSRWVAIFGATSSMTTDLGAQFEFNLFQFLLSFFKAVLASALQPSSGS
ncbi:hypothetical protein SprV_0301316400 [Sparganum proliferum]